MNSYNYLAKAPTVIQPVPHGQAEVCTFDCPPVVEYANHFKSIEELEEYLESLKYVPIQRPSDNFIFTESSDNFVDNSEYCMHCLRFYPSRLTPLDRGRHSVKTCPLRPVTCGVCGAGMAAKDFLYLHVFVCNPDLEQEDRRAGVWMWSTGVKRDRMLRREAEERAMYAESVARRISSDLEETERYAHQALASAEQELHYCRVKSRHHPAPGGECCAPVQQLGPPPPPMDYPRGGAPLMGATPMSIPPDHFSPTTSPTRGGPPPPYAGNPGRYMS